MSQKIIGFSGRKQSGKNTCSNVIIGWEMLSLGITRNFKITNSGQLWVSDILGEESNAGIFDVTSSDQSMVNFLKANLDHFVKLYSFADLLKKSICMDILGLTRDQCYGADKQKNTDTEISWSSLPFYDAETKNKKMTAREVMQVVGTDFFRALYPNVWADATIRKIQEDSPHIAIVADCRFPNEVEAIQNAGGKVIRLTKNSNGKDAHISEVALDKENFDWNKFDFIIENDDIPLGEQNKKLYGQLKEWGWLELSIAKGESK